jgi:hypothetical protein
MSRARKLFWRFPGGITIQRWANLQGAILMNANLEGANPSGANLQGANLREANLQGANLGQAHLQEAELKEAKFSEETALPDGSFWRPDANMARFTDPEHPSFWRSKYPNPASNNWEAELKAWVETMRSSEKGHSIPEELEELEEDDNSENGEDR